MSTADGNTGRPDPTQRYPAPEPQVQVLNVPSVTRILVGSQCSHVCIIMTHAVVHVPVEGLAERVVSLG